MKSSIELSIELIDQKIERIAKQRTEISKKAQRLIDQESVLKKQHEKLEEEKNKLLNSKKYVKTLKSRETEQGSELPEILQDAMHAADVSEN